MKASVVFPPVQAFVLVHGAVPLRERGQRPALGAGSYVRPERYVHVKEIAGRRVAGHIRCYAWFCEPCIGIMGDDGKDPREVYDRLDLAFIANVSLQ